MSAGDFYVGGSPDSLKLVINEAAARSMGWNDPQMALNRPVKFFGFPGTFYIKGVTKDFHFGSMKDKIQPLYFTPVEAGLVYRYLSFKLNNGSIADQVAMLQKEWNIVFPQTPFDYKFIDDSIASLYETETRMHKAARLSTVVAFALVALGVLGISAMSITRRTKEVGIRKLLGASYSSIVLLFLKEFSWIIVVSNIIGWPLSWYLLNHWLNGYSYRVSLGIIPFAAVGITVSGLVILIIALMLRRVAASNPIKSLQTE
jgi:putative ABC transport system permease protein